MRKKKRGYNFINILVIIVVVALFVYEYKGGSGIFSGENMVSLIVLVVAVTLVLIVKATRLYLALYGLEIKSMDYVKTYCKITPVSVIFPFKLGEFFRMYCIGNLIGNVLKGVVIILFDRFMDTIALVTTIAFVWILNGGKIASFVYVLLAFLIFILIIYFVYPEVYKFWKKYLLKSMSSEHKLAALKFLEQLNSIYREVESVARGRGIILYFMSLIAWGIEIGCLYILNGIDEKGKINQVISNYLTSAMGGGQSIELKRFIIVSVMILIILYLIIKIGELFVGKKDRQ